MNSAAILSRLKRIESMQPARLVVLARMPDGTEREMTAPEYVEAVKDGVDFIRAVRGNDLNDVHLVLGTYQSVIG